ncbi:hypothetical protein [Curtobacterium flaccumfaciens]|uniref:hypothetical protein n=1 Tax=Curtobacterium flaccumfaciens TaxID=2035 RepID=UPI001600D524|nr:hypothetical protein [Curtobacterium flaccumfaciens]MBB1198642.1 hypothetical protein [Curtobacterium flaccumfaciens]
MSEEEIGQEFDRVVRSVTMALGQLKEHASRKQAEHDSAARVEREQQQRVVERHVNDLHEAVRSNDFWAVADGQRVANVVDVVTAAGPDMPHTQNMYDTVRANLDRRYGIDLDEVLTAHPTDHAARRRGLVDAVDDAIAARKEHDAERDAGTSDDLDAKAAAVQNPNQHAAIVDGSEQAADAASTESSDAAAARADSVATADAPTADLAVTHAPATAQTAGGAEATVTHAPAAATRPLPAAAAAARDSVQVSYPLGARDSLASAARTGNVKPKAGAAKTQSREREIARTR